MRKVNLIYVVDDGITGHCSGVGTVARNFVSSFPGISREFGRAFGVDLALSIVTFSSPNGKKYDFYNKASKVVAESGGKIIEVRWPDSLSENYFDFHAWEEVNRDVSKLIGKNFSGEKLVIANDFIFGQIELSLKDTLVFIPHSLQYSHAQSYVDGAERVSWEKKSIEGIKKKKNAFVGYLSPYVKEVLAKEFSLKNSKLLPARNGFQFSGTDCLSTDEVLTKYGISNEEKLIISVSRADVYKGIEEVIAVMDSFLSHHQEYRGVIVASKFSLEPELLKYQKRLKDLITNPKITFIEGFEPNLPQALYCNPKSRALLCLPRADFAPLVPIEAMAFCHPELAVVVSEADCFKGLIQDSVNGFLAPKDPKVASKLLSALLENDKLSLVRQVNAVAKKEIFDKYDIFNNYFELITLALFDKNISTEYSAGGLITRIASEGKEFLLTEHLENTYSFPKGHIEKGESPEMAATREVIEETGFMEFEVAGRVGNVARYSVSNKDGQPVKKLITMFEVNLKSGKRHKEYEEVCKWFGPNEAVKVLRYKQDSDFLTKYIALEEKGL